MHTSVSFFFLILFFILISTISRRTKHVKRSTTPLSTRALTVFSKSSSLASPSWEPRTRKAEEIKHPCEKWGHLDRACANMHVHANRGGGDATTGKIVENDTAEIDLCLLCPGLRLVSTGVGRHFLAILRR